MRSTWLLRQLASWSATFGQRRVAWKWWQQVLDRDPDDLQALSAIGHLHAGAGHPSAAIECFERIVSLGAATPAHWFNLGFLRQQLEDHAAAIAAFDRAIDGDERLDRAWYGKALSLIKLGRVEDAIPLLQKNTELQPFSPFGWYQLAHAYNRLGRTEQVERTIRQLGGFEPKVARQLERETGVHVGIDVPF